MFKRYTLCDGWSCVVEHQDETKRESATMLYAMQMGTSRWGPHTPSAHYCGRHLCAYPYITYSKASRSSRWGGMQHPGAYRTRHRFPSDSAAGAGVGVVYCTVVCSKCPRQRKASTKFGEGGPGTAKKGASVPCQRIGEHGGSMFDVFSCTTFERPDQPPWLYIPPGLDGGRFQRTPHGRPGGRIISLMMFSKAGGIISSP